MRLQAIAQNGLAYTDNPFDHERSQSLRDIAAEIGYATPKVAVRGAVFRDDSLVFVRERHDDLWAIPGG